MPRTTRAFTLLELLLSVGIIALLVTLVVASMRTVRTSASRADSMGALRQMSVGFASYSTDHRQQILPGYIDETLFGNGLFFANLKARLANGEVLDALDSGSYVWRLAPYLDHAWTTFFRETEPRVVGQFSNEFGGGNFGPAETSEYDGGIAERPAYGLNSIFVGGDSQHGSVASRNPWGTANVPFAATRLSQVLNPSRLIIFAPAAKAAVSGAETYENPEVGYCELRPPYFPVDGEVSDNYDSPQWDIGVKGLVQAATGADLASGAGLPIDRTGGDKIPVIHLDGSGTVEQIGAISRDMVRWNPHETMKPHRKWSGSPNTGK